MRFLHLTHLSRLNSSGLLSPAVYKVILFLISILNNEWPSGMLSFDRQIDMIKFGSCLTDLRVFRYEISHPYSWVHRVMAYIHA